METFVIQTDEAGAADLKAAAAGAPDVEFQARKVHAQVGDPDTWMFVIKMAPPALSALGAAIMLLIRQRKIKVIKIGKKEFRDITIKEFERAMAALKARRSPRR